ncbi:MAG: DUF6580 family putative transport protein [Candidatus Paceibacterota bacterium]|jgi:hypothetical protein
MLNINAKTKFICAMILIGSGVTGRFLLVSYSGIPNLEIISALSLIAGIYIGGVYAAIVPISIVFLSDLVIGNNYIFVFTWTAFAIIGVFGSLFKDKFKSIKLGNSIALAILSATFFYVYTNFGWWLMSGMYEHSLNGLISCYAAGLPFFRNNILGNLIFVPSFIYMFQMLWKHSQADIALKAIKHYN